MLMIHGALDRVGSVILLLMILLAMMLLVARVLEFVMIVHLHVSLLTIDAVHHGMLLVVLPIHAKRIMRRRL